MIYECLSNNEWNLHQSLEHAVSPKYALDQKLRIWATFTFWRTRWICAEWEKEARYENFCSICFIIRKMLTFFELWTRKVSYWIHVFKTVGKLVGFDLQRSFGEKIRRIDNLVTSVSLNLQWKMMRNESISPVNVCIYSTVRFKFCFESSLKCRFNAVGRFFYFEVIKRTKYLSCIEGLNVNPVPKLQTGIIYSKT